MIYVEDDERLTTTDAQSPDGNMRTMKWPYFVAGEEKIILQNWGNQGRGRPEGEVDACTEYMRD